MTLLRRVYQKLARKDKSRAFHMAIACDLLQWPYLWGGMYIMWVAVCPPCRCAIVTNILSSGSARADRNTRKGGQVSCLRAGIIALAC